MTHCCCFFFFFPLHPNFHSCLLEILHLFLLIWCVQEAELLTCHWCTSQLKKEVSRQSKEGKRQSLSNFYFTCIIAVHLAKWPPTGILEQKSLTDFSLYSPPVSFTSFLPLVTSTTLTHLAIIKWQHMRKVTCLGTAYWHNHHNKYMLSCSIMDPSYQCHLQWPLRYHRPFIFTEIFQFKHYKSCLTICIWLSASKEDI